MNKFHKILVMFAWIFCVVTSGVALTSIAVKARTDYKVEKVSTINMRKVVGDAKNIYSNPVSLKSRVVGNTNDLANKEVSIVAKAKVGKQLFYQIKREGKVYGWINSSSLKTTKEYVLPYTYTSQLYPTYAPSGCEAASLKMALSTKGIAKNVSYKKFLDGIPRNKDAKKGYDANPYKKGVGATIYPSALVKYAKKYNADSKDITGAPVTRLISEIKRGNPILFEGSFRMKNTDSSHVLAALGYKDGKILVADPYMDKNDTNKVFWVKTADFTKIYNKRDRLAMVVY